MILLMISISYMYYISLRLIIYVCYLVCNWQFKVFMEEISLFVSICWHRHVPIYRILRSGAWHDFVGIRAMLSNIIRNTYTIKPIYMIIIYEIIWVNSYLTFFSNSVLVQSISENSWTITLIWLFHRVFI